MCSLRLSSSFDVLAVPLLDWAFSHIARKSRIVHVQGLLPQYSLRKGHRGEQGAILLGIKIRQKLPFALQGCSTYGLFYLRAELADKDFESCPNPTPGSLTRTNQRTQVSASWQCTLAAYLTYGSFNHDTKSFDSHHCR